MLVERGGIVAIEPGSRTLSLPNPATRNCKPLKETCNQQIVGISTLGTNPEKHLLTHLVKVQPRAMLVCASIE
jgi:hypothetical protein